METSVTGPDPSWKKLYNVGGISAIFYVILGIILPAILVLFMSYDFHMGGADLLVYIAFHRLLWMLLQTLVLGTSILAIIAFVAIFMVIRHLNQSYAVLGTVITVTCQILFMAYYPVLLGLVYLSDHYLSAAGTQQDTLVSAAEALIAINNAFNPLYESVFAIGILILSMVMLKGVFNKSVAYIGITTAPAAFIGLSLWPIVDVAYFWWWLLFVIWFSAVGLKLYRLGSE